MRVHVVVTDGAGKVFEGDADLAPVARVQPAKGPPQRKQKPATTNPPKLNFSLPLRAVMNRWAKGLTALPS